MTRRDAVFLCGSDIRKMVEMGRDWGVEKLLKRGERKS